MFKHMIAIDGGATKTHGVIFDASGNIQKEKISGYCNFGVDEIASKTNIKATIDALLENTKGIYEIDFILIGTAGYSNLKNKKGFIEELQECYHIPVFLHTDADLALASIRKNTNTPTILILGGTGSIVLATEENEVIRIGGSGHILGDEGSAYHAAISGLKFVMDEFESKRPRSTFSKHLLDEINIQTHEELIHYVYSKNKKEIAELSKTISKLSLEGNSTAIKLLSQEGHELAQQAIKAYGLLTSKEPTIIGFQGGFLLNAPYVKESLNDRLNESMMKYQIIEDHVDPILGAYYLGLLKTIREVNHG